MKVFWSWQSDSPQASGRHFVHAALKAATATLADHPDLEDVERPEVDSDTTNIPGSPHIAETILRKIRECAVFVADVTPVGKTPGGKKLANQNVMIELGYALATIGSERIVLVMNQAEGASLRALPFDLRHWRGPITYSLSKSPREDQVESALAELTDALVARLGPSLAFAVSNRPPMAVAEGVPADDADPAVWSGARPAMRVRAQHAGEVQLPISDGPKVFVRIIPAAPFEASRTDMSTSRGGTLPLFPPGDYHNLWSGTSPAGAVAWNWNPNPPELNALTQWFQETGEIWSIWPNALIEWHDQLTFTDAYVARGLEQFFERHFATLEQHSARRPWRVVVGARGLEGSILPGGRYARGKFGALANEARYEQLVTTPTPAVAREISFAFMRRIYDAYGAPNLDAAGYERLLQDQR